MKNCKMRSGSSKKGESPDSDRIRAEDIKACDEGTKEMVRQIFIEIIKQNEFTLEAWKKVKIKVLHKKGDVENVGNYRPICSLLALYLDQEQAEDQAGFRRSYQTTDHLATYRLIEQTCHEWCIKNVDSNDRLHEGFRLHHAQINLESTQFPSTSAF